MDFKGSRTEKNLLVSFAGESQARMRYDYFASQAKKDGFVQISNIFTETALQEKEHAKRFFKFLRGGDVEITAPFPAGQIRSTQENLIAAAEGENHEWTELYPGFAETAREEGFENVAKVVGRDLRGRAEPREALPGPGPQHRGRPRLRPRARAGLVLPELRLHPRGPRGARRSARRARTRRPTSACWPRTGRPIGPTALSGAGP